MIPIQPNAVIHKKVLPREQFFKLDFEGEAAIIKIDNQGTNLVAWYVASRHDEQDDKSYPVYFRWVMTGEDFDIRDKKYVDTVQWMNLVLHLFTYTDQEAWIREKQKAENAKVEV